MGVTGATFSPLARGANLTISSITPGGAPQIVHTPGTPAGTYTLDVSATVTSAVTSSTLTHDLKLTLTVN